jgi:hypothetical protein
MRKLIALLIIIFFAVLATVPGWSIIGFSQALANNEQIVSYIFLFMALAIVAILIVLVWWLLFKDKSNDQL